MPCSLCSRSDRALIDERVMAGRSYRSIALEFGTTKDAVGRHATGHLAQRRAENAKRTSAAARKRVRRGEQCADEIAAQPIGDLDRVGIMTEYGKMYVEARAQLERAKTSGDMVRIGKAIDGCLEVLDRHAKAQGIFASDGAVVIDARSQKIEMAINSMSEAELRNILALAAGADG